MVTQRGHVGVVPNLVKVGDVVAVFKGGLVPFILWESESWSRVFRLVGECYVHGIMHGEGMFLPGVEDTTLFIH
jgi:hypothetical protein